MTTSPQADATASATKILDPHHPRGNEAKLSLAAYVLPSVVKELSDEELVRAIALCERELRRRKNR